jgi:hypothetical protein
VNPFTETAWEKISGSVELLEEVTAIMRHEYKPFLNHEQAFAANTNLLKQHMREKSTRWLEWLPTLSIDQVGGALAEEAFERVEWRHIAGLVQEQVAMKSLGMQL